MALFEGERKADETWLGRHSLSIVLVVLMVIQTAYAVWSGAVVWANEDPFDLKDPALTDDFWVWWSWEYNVSLVADTFGVLLIVVLSKWLYEEGSAESAPQSGE